LQYADILSEPWFFGFKDYHDEKMCQRTIPLGITAECFQKIVVWWVLAGCYTICSSGYLSNIGSLNEESGDSVLSEKANALVFRGIRIEHFFGVHVSDDTYNKYGQYNEAHFAFALILPHKPYEERDERYHENYPENVGCSVHGC
jgi:hypothetical protein